MTPSSQTSDRFLRARAEIDAFVAKYENEPQHTRHVTKLALRLFDELAQRHKLGATPRFYLEAAASMHDSGWFENPGGSGHHKKSFRLISQHPWENLSPDEVAIIALVARYHRKAEPTTEHEEFAALERPDRQLVRTLAGLLRVADALDRSHMQSVRDFHLEQDGERMVLRTGPVAGWEAAEFGVEKKKGLFEKVFKARLEIGV